MIHGQLGDVLGSGNLSTGATVSVDGSAAVDTLRAFPLPPHAGGAAAFGQLCADAAACQRCPAMVGRTRILTPMNGAPGARVIFIGEAPGRLGGDRTGVPFSGDQSGRNFERLLAAANLTRAEIFVTNAVLCNPRDEQGRNRGPTRRELAACEDLLARQLAVIAAPVVVTLGAVALKALNALAAHGLQLRDAVGQIVPWQGRLLMPLYHPGPRAQLHRSLVIQSDDFTALGQLVQSLQEGTFAFNNAF